MSSNEGNLNGYEPCTTNSNMHKIIDGKKAHPWGISNLTEKKAFTDVMSEDLAENLQIRDQKDVPTMDGQAAIFDGLCLEESSDTNNDLLLAQMLQYEFDREFDNQLQREEKHMNKDSKLSISLSKFKVCPEWYGSDSDEDLTNLDDENRMLDSFEERGMNEPVIPPCGYVCHNNKMVTKHDITICGRKNAQRVMNLPPGVNTGDGGGFDMELSNKVYNKLLNTTRKEWNRKHRVHDKSEKAIVEHALDPKTRLVVFKMVNNGILETVNGIISTGKEAAVFHAVGGIFEEKELPNECALKIFKTSMTDFKTRERYIKNDYRFKDRVSKNNNRTTIKLWAEKEFHNLRRLQLANIPSPKPILIRQQVLVMSFIGENQVAAPKLKNVVMGTAGWEVAYNQMEEIMVSLFTNSKLVHADMSEYNILWYEEQCWIIDLGQAVEPTHPSALKFLYRDCCNITRFFKSKGVQMVPSPSVLFTKISGLKLGLEESEAEILIGDYQVDYETKKDEKNDDRFDFLWEQMQIKRSEGTEDYDDNVSNVEGDEIDPEEVDLDEETWKQIPTKRRGKKSKMKSTPQMYEGVVDVQSNDATVAVEA